LVEQHFDRSARIDTAEYDRYWVLTSAGGIDLPRQVTVQAVSGSETLIASTQKFQGALRSERSLYIAGGYIDVLDAVG
jgi:hypothetical protein